MGLTTLIISFEWPNYYCQTFPYHGSHWQGNQNRDFHRKIVRFTIYVLASDLRSPEKCNPGGSRGILRIFFAWQSWRRCLHGATSWVCCSREFSLVCKLHCSLCRLKQFQWAWLGKFNRIVQTFGLKQWVRSFCFLLSYIP